ncbi:MAG: hypothetical protein ABIU95_08925 [Burkholderiales bacterium]
MLNKYCLAFIYRGRGTSYPNFFIVSLETARACSIFNARQREVAATA